MKDCIRDYVTENPGINYDAIVGRFGNPQKIAESYVVEMEPTDLIVNMKVGQKILTTILAVAALLVMVRFGFRLAAFMSFHKDAKGYAVVEVIEVERKIIDEGGG